MEQSKEQKQPECKICSKSRPEVKLMNCAKCRKVAYCSRECQTVDWPAHKTSCGQQSYTGATNSANSNSGGGTTGSNSTAVKGLDGCVDKPFTRLDKGTWLHDRSEKDVYRLLIDSFRMRIEDNYSLDADNTQGTVYAGEPHSLPGFRRYLNKVASRPGLLPPWWTAEKRAECERLGMDHGQHNWCDLGCAIEKHDVIEHYGDSKFPMQLRMFAEAAYGNGPGGSDGSAMRRMMMAMESGSSDIQSTFMSL